MTKLLEQAIAKARALPEEDQDALALTILAMAEGPNSLRLSPEQVEDVRRIQSDLREGRTRLATDEEMAALWKQCGQ